MAKSRRITDIKGESIVNYGLVAPRSATRVDNDRLKLGVANVAFVVMRSNTRRNLLSYLFAF